MSQTPSNPGAQYFPLYLPNLPRGSPLVDFAQAYLGMEDTLAEKLNTSRRLAQRTLQEFSSNTPTRAVEVENIVKDYLTLVTGLLLDPSASSAPTAPTAAPADTPTATPADTPAAEGETSADDTTPPTTIRFRSASAAAAALIKPASKSAPTRSLTPIARSCAFTWENMSLVKVTSSSGGVDFEVSHILHGLGLWYLNAGKDLALSKDEQKCKEAFWFFNKAAGVYDCLANRDLPDEVAASSKGSDLKTSVWRGFVELACAESQSVVITSTEKKRTPALLSSLAREVSERYNSALACFQPAATGNTAPNKKFLALLEFKATYFFAMAYLYQGLDFIEREAPETGKGIKACHEAIVQLQRAGKVFNDFLGLSPKSPGQDSTKYMNDLVTYIEAVKAKANRLNDTVYFLPVPEVAEKLPESKSIAQLVPFVVPSPNEQTWTAEILNKITPVAKPPKKEKLSGCCFFTRKPTSN